MWGSSGCCEKRGQKARLTTALLRRESASNVFYHPLQMDFAKKREMPDHSRLNRTLESSSLSFALNRGYLCSNVSIWPRALALVRS